MVSNDKIAFARRIFTARQVPFRYLVIPKCGCTYIKNIIWQLDHVAPHPNPKRIHDFDEQFARASDIGFTDLTLRVEGVSFTILRNPIDRLFSLYLDKVIGTGFERFVPLRLTLVEKFGLDPTPLTKTDHVRNCNILIEWIGSNLSEGIDIPRDPHWTPQSWRENAIEALDLKILLLSHLDSQLGFFRGDLIPQRAGNMDSEDLNRTQKSLAKADIFDKKLRDKVNSVYAADRRLFNLAKSAWAKLDLEQDSPVATPCYSSIISGGR